MRTLKRTERVTTTGCLGRVIRRIAVVLVPLLCSAPSGCGLEEPIGGTPCGDGTYCPPGLQCVPTTGGDFTCRQDSGCGDGFLALGEACDDGNVLSDDGCNDTCEIETGWSCQVINPAAMKLAKTAFSPMPADRAMG